MDNQPPKIKVMGERATGTNFLSAVLRDNFNVTLYRNAPALDAQQKTLLPSWFAGGWSSRRATREAMLDENHSRDISQNGGWKHAAVSEHFRQGFVEKEQPTVICIVRHPVSWSTSLHNKPIHGIARVARNYSDFLHSPWVCAARDELPSRIADSPLAMYRDKVESYVALQSVYAKVFLIRYEDLLFCAEDTLAPAGLQKKDPTSAIALPDKSARPFETKGGNHNAYVDKAKSAGYDKLAETDRRFMQTSLAGSTLGRLYPVP